jgi:hypothetical protein
MRPIFTIHAGEFMVGQHLEKMGKNIWIPTKDSGVDLLVTNSDSTKSIALQIKFSRDFLPAMKLPLSMQGRLRSCTWFTLNRNKLVRSRAKLWVLVLRGFERNSVDYIVIAPAELRKKLEQIHGIIDTYQAYVWVAKHGRGKAWLTRGLRKAARSQIGDNTFIDDMRDLSRYLNNWDAIKRL